MLIVLPLPVYVDRSNADSSFAQDIREFDLRLERARRWRRRRRLLRLRRLLRGRMRMAAGRPACACVPSPAH